ncbi:MAG: hypothetical protein DRG30_00485 [Epsilonproteobacteria bacterium]|nr:MAG: hypothetical protein DRG30_00485 [Campylobacterota bacterium]
MEILEANRNNSPMKLEQPKHRSLNISARVYRYQFGLIILISFVFVALLIHYFGWWEVIGILFLKFGLGAKVAGAKSFAQAIVKAGGKKAIALATAGMLTKRHIIDIFSKFFAEHSIKRYKRNLTLVMKRIFEEIKHSSPVKKLRALGSMLLSVPIFYFFWTKVLGTAIQKFVYALVLPLFTLLWNFIMSSLNFLSFIFQILMLNLFLDTLANYRWGKKIITFINSTIHILGKILGLLNKLLEQIGLNPKKWIIKLSNYFNRWLESILDKGLNMVEKLRKKRERYTNIAKALSDKRYRYAQSKKDKQISYWNYTRELFNEKVLKKRDWKKNRKARAKRWEQRL